MLGSGTVEALGDLKLNAEVRSPVTARRHFVMLDSLILEWLPKRCSMNCTSEV